MATSEDVASHLISAVCLVALRDRQWPVGNIPAGGAAPSKDLADRYDVGSAAFSEAYATKNGLALIATDADYFVTARPFIGSGAVDGIEARITREHGVALSKRDEPGSRTGFRVRVMTVGFDTDRFAVVTMTYPADQRADRDDLQATMQAYSRVKTDGR